MPPLLEYRLKYPSLGLHSEGVTCVDIDPTGKYVAAGGSDGRIFISNLDDGRLHHLVLTRSPVTAVIWVEADWPTLICCCQSGIILTVVITLVRMIWPCTLWPNVFHRTPWTLPTSAPGITALTEPVSAEIISLQAPVLTYESGKADINVRISEATSFMV
ncbi:hypothetical protein SCP_1900880 [Sparassis crispa]|uniref:Uncharacterized protein n=1 Tax=Sparassis crispa TaxID=139825 RepID=A0A401H783_9APHY|nr:hypothetical protein SCP_1900880 [Sparassis crispa]GBE90239.1 hypothetical protein SCP_1900880 [Sparassis crispa]